MAANGNSEPRKRGCGARLLRGCGWTLFILVALVLGSYLVEVYRCSRYTPTGDALFDKYARAVIQRQAWRLFASGKTHPATLPDELLDEWEGEFGKDPRYWQLRYWCELYRDFLPGFNREWAAIREPNTESIKFLHEARERDAVDAALIYCLLDEQRRIWKRETDAKQYELMELPDEEYREQVIVLYDDYEGRLDGLYSECIAAAPEQALLYYDRAFHWFEYGELERMQEDLHAGNHAAEATYLRPFPVSAILEQTESSAATGSAFVAGAVLEVENASHSTNWIKRKEMGKGVLVAAALGDQRELLSEFHQYSCKLGVMDHAGVGEALVASAFANQQADYILAENGSELSAIQRRALIYVINSYWATWQSATKWAVMTREQSLGMQLYQRQRWRLELYSWGPDMYDFLDESRPQAHWINAWWDFFLLKLAHKRFEAYFREGRQEASFYVRYLKPRITELALLDYTSLDYPDRWPIDGINPSWPR